MYEKMMDTIGLVKEADPELAAAMNRELTRQRENIVQPLSLAHARRLSW